MFCSFHLGNFIFSYFGHLFHHFSCVIFFMKCSGFFSILPVLPCKMRTFKKSKQTEDDQNTKKKEVTKMKWTKHKSHTKVFYILGFVRDFRVSKINLFCFKNCRQFYEVPNPTYTTLEDCILVHVASKLIRFSAWVSLKNLIGKNLTKDSLLFVYKSIVSKWSALNCLYCTM